jgi:hypothetical protein
MLPSVVYALFLKDNPKGPVDKTRDTAWLVENQRQMVMIGV